MKQKKFTSHQKKKQFIDALRWFQIYKMKMEYQKLQTYQAAYLIKYLRLLLKN